MAINMQIVLASNCENVEAQYVEMMVPLYSHGCEKKVKKTLSHLKGVSFEKGTLRMRTHKSPPSSIPSYLKSNMMACIMTAPEKNWKTF
ncbi:hypothetical protein D5086_022737 [Populus alba]|uniref:Uncharacterized protein n=1 Tax=Populus alba TaxID=43335 RepID=A0ACC4B8E9_POPAL